MVDLSVRSRQPELMDGDDVSQGQFTACMVDLAKVNTVTMSRPPTLSFIYRALSSLPADSCPVILDVGYGAGDMLRAIRKRCDTMGLKARLIGIDLNPRSKIVAGELTPPKDNIEYRTMDLYNWSDGEPVDLVISSFVTHHMDDGEIVKFLRWMEQRARLGWFINDLHRSSFAYHGFRLLSTLAGWHPFVRHDGPLSVSRSFRREDWLALLEQADIADAAAVEWKFPFRYCVTRPKW